MDKIINQIMTSLGQGYTYTQQGVLMWIFKEGKPVERLDLNYCTEMDKRNELETIIEKIKEI
jgi:hypothetical protein